MPSIPRSELTSRCCASQQQGTGSELSTRPSQGARYYFRCYGRRPNRAEPHRGLVMTPIGIARGLRNILRHPRNLLLVTQYIWNVRIKRKPLVVLERSGGMGDLVCLLASIPGLRTRHPNSWLVLIAPPGCSQLAVSSSLCDAVSDTGTVFHRFIRGRCSTSRYYC